jgi:cytidylate kinase
VPASGGRLLGGVRMLVITFFAELGSDGEYVARAVARRLGLSLIDRNVLAAAVSEVLAEGSEVPEYHTARGRWVRQIAQRALTLARRETIEPYPDPPPFVTAGAIADEAYSRLLQAVLLDMSRTGRVLIMGRGAEALLRDHPTCLHLRTVAPLERRVLKVMKLLGVDRAAAQETIERADSVHSGYLKYALNVDWTDPSLYDLTINTARFPEEKAVELIVNAAAVLGYRRRARRSSDALPPAPVEPALPPAPVEEETAEVGAGR